jgi:hypothetical protein
MKHSPRGYQIKHAAFYRTGNNVALTQLQIRRGDFDQRQIEIDSHCFSLRTYSLREPYGNRAVATSDLERTRARLHHAKQLDMAAMHWIQQFRHQRQPLLLARQMMTQNVFRHITRFLFRVMVSAFSNRPLKKSNRPTAAGLCL